MVIGTSVETGGCGATGGWTVGGGCAATGCWPVAVVLWAWAGVSHSMVPTMSRPRPRPTHRIEHGGCIRSPSLGTPGNGLAPLTHDGSPSGLRAPRNVCETHALLWLQRRYGRSVYQPFSLDAINKTQRI